MRRVWTLIGIMSAALLLVSCGDEGAHQQAGDAESHASDPILAVAGDGLDGLSLNDGRKWEMDDHTRSSFGKMAASFLDSDHVSLEGAGLQKVGADLQVQIDELIQGCTMTGDAHGQLHIYLSAYIPAVAGLAESGRIEDARKVKHYLEKYTAYFE